MNLTELLKKNEEKIANGDRFPANGGTETPFVSRSGKKLLYVWRPVDGKHAYLDCDSDIILTDEEAWNHLGKF
jgi:hypothetical protein